MIFSFQEKTLIETGFVDPENDFRVIFCIPQPGWESVYNASSGCVLKGVLAGGVPART